MKLIKILSLLVALVMSVSIAATGVASDNQTVPGGMALIPGGTFTMGSPDTEGNHNEDELSHEVTVSAFYMGTNPVTQAEYEAIMGNNPSSGQGANHPVENTSWFDAVEYCNRRSEAEDLTPAYTIDGDSVTWNQNANGYRLPTEAEWEYACRAGTTTAYFFGDEITTGQVNYGGGSTSEASTYPANAFGLHDMHGNVWEWCWDRYAPYPADAQTDPTGAETGDTRLLRGGSYFDGQAQYLRSAMRVHYPPTTRYFDVGFRVARSIK